MATTAAASTLGLGARVSYTSPSDSVPRAAAWRPRPATATRGSVRVRAEGINPAIRKDEEKVVDSVLVAELSKPLTAYCRCWRSGTFPLCDGSHVKHNKATGDNVGPLLVKKEKA